MAQETRVVEISKNAAAALGKLLDAGGFSFQTVPYAEFSYTKPGIAATYYHSGKLVIQGRDLDVFLQQYLEDSAVANSTESPDDERIGSDEAGKGDYFGPLTVAAVYVSKDDIGRLRKIGVADSKVLSDETIARLAAAIEASTAHAIVSVMPADYNERYKNIGNVNKLLGELHGEVILSVVDKSPCRRVLTDQFGDIAHVRRGFGARAKEIELEARPRAEAHVAVAAASILARNAFVEGIKALSDECGVDLPKGAGDPVDATLPKLVAIVGRENLKNFAKLHFRTTQKVLDRLF
ncbi:MAG: ribonuclease HIII [Planctomycetes bacterium]|nr:ribonuclease HIII [Planctomycetota bacterium]